MIKPLRKRGRVVLGLSLLLLSAGCGGKVSAPPDAPPEIPERNLRPMAYSVQAGAFSNLDNAVRFTASLNDLGLDAIYFIDNDRLYKVRFGNFASEEEARGEAGKLLASGTIGEYYLIRPGEHGAARGTGGPGERDIRDSLVATAESFIGIPYRWGGTSAEEGFDCSGFVMTVYRLNGLDLRRTAREQFQSGRPVKRSRLKRGDLVFFAPSRGKSVNHVAIYTSDNQFIHASTKTRNIRSESLSKTYFESRYAGARTYLR